MSILFIVLIIIVASAAAGTVFFVHRKPYPSLPPRNNAEAVAEEEYIPLELYGLYCFIRKGEDGLMINHVFRFSDNAGKDDNGAVLSAVIGQRKPEDGYFPKEKWFNWDWNYENEDRPGGRWKRSGNNIRFTIELKRGTILYRGTIREDSLVLNSQSEITGHREEGAVFQLYRFEEVPGWWD